MTTKVKKHQKDRHRSGLEVRIAEELNKKKIVYEYEPKDGKLTYEVPSKTCTYTPDFYIRTKTGKEIIVESKGIWDYADRFKHLLIRQQHPHLDIRFVFTRAKQRIRKGSKTTYGDICSGLGRGPFRGIKWKYAEGTIPDEWLKE